MWAREEAQDPFQKLISPMASCVFPYRPNGIRHPMISFLKQAFREIVYLGVLSCRMEKNLRLAACVRHHYAEILSLSGEGKLNYLMEPISRAGIQWHPINGKQKTAY